MRKPLLLGLVAALTPLSALALTFDTNVSPGVIFGSGNVNGSFTVDSANGVEIGLRGKLRHGPSGAPANIFNSNGDGTYSFAAGVAPTQAAPTAVWSYEWSINTDVDGTTGWTLDDLVYVLSLDNDPSMGTSFSSFDPINQVFFDHSMGNNGTTAATDVKAANAGQYATNLGLYNVAQNSWKPHWYFAPGFDPTLDATYDISLAAYNGSTLLAKSSIQIIVGAGGAAVPDASTTGLMVGGALMGLLALRRRR